MEPKAIGKRRIIVTVRPSDGHDGLLRIDDAMLQVLDFIRLANEAKLAMGQVQDDFEWYLQSATASSPFTVVAVANPVDPNRDVGDHVRDVERETSAAITKVMHGDAPPGWVSSQALHCIYAILRRNANGVASTRFDFDGDVETVEIRKGDIKRPEFYLDASDVEFGTPPRVAHGELSGVLVSVGHWRGKPSLIIRSNMYGNVWCVLAPHLIDQWGDTTTVSSVWRGKKLVAYGRLIYWKGGKLSRVETDSVRERISSPVDIESVLDPDFTSGLDPVEYLDQLHGGRLG